MDLNDEELEALHDIVYDKACYGDDDIVYGDGPEAVMVRNLMALLDEEVKRRKLW